MLRSEQYILKAHLIDAYIPFDGDFTSELNTIKPPKVFGTKTVAGAFRMRWEEKHPEVMLDIATVYVVTTL